LWFKVRKPAAVVSPTKPVYSKEFA